MTKRNRRIRNRTGHYCWACDSFRANERFSGKGHARHLCRDCSKRGADELAYRQALRNLERCATLEGIIPRKQRKTFDNFLHHTDPRIRGLATEMKREDAIARAFQRAMSGQLSAWDEMERFLKSTESSDEYSFEVDPFDECNAELRDVREQSFEWDQQLERYEEDIPF